MVKMGAMITSSDVKVYEEVINLKPYRVYRENGTTYKFVLYTKDDTRSIVRLDFTDRCRTLKSLKVINF